MVIRKSGSYTEQRIPSCRGDCGRNYNGVEKHPFHSRRVKMFSKVPNFFSMLRQRRMPRCRGACHALLRRPASTFTGYLGAGGCSRSQGVSML